MRDRAFTLIELVVASGIIALLSASLFGFIMDLQQRQQDLLMEIERTREASVLFQEIERAVYTTTAKGVDGLPGFQGTNSMLAISYKIRHGDQAHLKRFEITADSGAVNLQERLRDDDGVSTRSEHIQRVEFAYYVDQQWQSSHSSLESGLPKAVRVKLWYSTRVPGSQANDDADNRVLSDNEEEPSPDRVRIIAVPGERV